MLPVRLLSLSLPGLVFFLQFVAFFPDSFFDSQCPVGPFDPSYSESVDAGLGLFVFLSSILAWVVFLLYISHHFKDINLEARRRRAMKNRTWIWFGWVQASFRFMKSWISSAWYVPFKMMF